MKTQIQKLVPVVALGIAAAFSGSAFADSAIGTWRTIETYSGYVQPAKQAVQNKDAAAYVSQGWRSIELSYSMDDLIGKPGEAARGQAGPAGPSIIDGRHIWDPVNIEATNSPIDPNFGL